MDDENLRGRAADEGSLRRRDGWMKEVMTETALLDRDALVAALSGRSIVLVGMMGAGKTSVGRRLAALLDLPFVDADGEIEAGAQMTVPEIFERFGEAYFREGERKVLARLLSEGQKVLATGGGAFMNEATRRQDRSIRRLDLAEARFRGADAPGPQAVEPPVAANGQSRGDPAPPAARSAARSMALADLTIEPRDGPHESVVEAIVSALGRASGERSARRRAERRRFRACGGADSGSRSRAGRPRLQDIDRRGPDR